ncbi:MAG: hypothetical protein L0271_24530 [Gemmatimonadetes bacterium]|nr:hypothetical protein [Gemmatimonadota bacterium]
MTAPRVFMAALLLSVSTSPPARSQETRVLRGRIVALDRSAVGGQRVRIADVGEATVRASGEFQVEIPSSATAIDVLLLTGGGAPDTSRAIVYPLNGRAPVPAGDEPVVILVGEPVERAITRALAERRRLSEQILSEYGVQSERLGMVESGIQRILERLDLREQDLRDEVARKERQAEAWPPIAEPVRQWVNEARDLYTALSLMTPLLDRNPPAEALRQLERAIADYNQAYTSLVPRRDEFEMQLERDWEDGAAARRDYADVLDNVVEQIHFQQIKPLNDQLAIVYAGLTSGNRDAGFRNAMALIAATLPALERALDQAVIRTDRAIAQLRPS